MKYLYGLIAFSIVLGLLISSCTSSETSIQTAVAGTQLAMVSLTPDASSTPEPTFTFTAMTIPTSTLEISRTPTPSSTPEPVPVFTRTPGPTPTLEKSWTSYTNKFLGYTIHLPPDVSIRTRGFGGLVTDFPVPAQFPDFWAFFDYLEDILPSNLCLEVNLVREHAYMTIAPPEPFGDMVSPCPGMGIGNQYKWVTNVREFTLEGETLSTGCTQLILESNNQLDSEFCIFTPDNGFRITLIAGASKQDYEATWDTLAQSLSSLHWSKVPDLTLPGTTCAGAFTYLLPGKTAMVSTDNETPNRVRSGPSRNNEIIAQLYPGDIAEVIEGPVCAEGLIFWKVSSSQIPGGVGWTAEGDGTEYYLVPYP